MVKKRIKTKSNRNTYLVIIAVIFLVAIGSYFFTNSSTQASEEAKSPFGGHVHALAINPETGDLFLGARPLYKSSDGGKSWTKIELPKSQERANVVSIAINKKNPDVMYVVGHGHSVVKSTDGGETWEIKDEGLKGDSVEAIAIDSNDEDKLYAWVLGDGLYRSLDAGESWKRVDDGPKDQEIRSLISVDIETGMGGIWLYAALDDGVKKSPDCFCGWDKIPNQGLPKDKRVYSLSVDSKSPEILYAGLRDGIFKTEDGGKNWVNIFDVVSDAVVTVHPKNSEMIYASSDRGEIFFSENSGKTWQEIIVEEIIIGENSQ